MYCNRSADSGGTALKLGVKSNARIGCDAFIEDREVGPGVNQSTHIERVRSEDFYPHYRFENNGNREVAIS